ncbi:MAG: hypothetical protein E6G43_11965 [Actinobacteria bacterium]|nr:MAG: hypothetical protein E6G43_11965 [Actinomycetota bacterium]
MPISEKFGDGDDQQEELAGFGSTAVTPDEIDVDDDVRVPPGHLQMLVICNGTFATHALRDGTLSLASRLTSSVDGSAT